MEAMHVEMAFMCQNDVRDLVELLNGCRRVSKTKPDSIGQVEMSEARLVGKGFGQSDVIGL